jgi:hypothetical protein
MTMMVFGMGGEEWERRSARKRPTQPPPDIRTGRDDEEDAALDRPLGLLFVVVVFEVPLEVVLGNECPFVVPFVTAMIPKLTLDG